MIYLIIISITVIIIFYLKSNQLNNSFYVIEDIDPKLKLLEKNYGIISEELNKNEKTWIDWPEKCLYQDNNWKVIPIYAFGKWVPKVSLCFPKLKEITNNIPDIETILFSRIMPKNTINPHQGWSSLSNRILRCHLPIYLDPNSTNKNFIAVEKEKRYHQLGKLIIFDDSKMHYSANLSDDERIVLIIDIKRPKWVKWGKSEVSDSPELLNIIREMLLTK